MHISHCELVNACLLLANMYSSYPEYLGLQTILLGTTLSLIIALWIYVNYYRSPRHLEQPPGPPGWPIIGNLLAVLKHPGYSNEDYYFSRCAREYGDIYKLQFGRQLVYVLNNVEHIREVFAHSDVQGRLPSMAAQIALGPEATGIITASGQDWSVMRKFMLTCFRDLNVGRGIFADTINLEVERLIIELNGVTDKPFWDLHELFYSAIGNILCGIAFGHMYDYDDVEFKEVIGLMKGISEATGAGGVVLFSKVLCQLPFGPGRRLMVEFYKFKTLVEDRIRITKSMLKSDEQANSFVNAFLTKMGEDEPSFVENNLTNCCMELFFAGTDTTTATLSSAFLYLSTHPTAQMECQRELDNYVKEHGLPRYSDRSQLPYTQAVILETERHASAVPLGVPHLVMEDLNLLGYDFPMGTLVIGNTQAIHMDKDRFPDPSEFRPERFMDSGHLESDADIIPFSVGRRACPGEPLARMEIFLFMVNLLHRFTFSPPDGIEIPDYRKGVYGGTRKPLPFAVVIKKR